MSSEYPPMVRLNSELVPIDCDELTPELNKKLLSELMTVEQTAAFEEMEEVDFSYEIPGVTRLRCNIFEQRAGITAVFRRVPIKREEAELRCTCVSPQIGLFCWLLNSPAIKRVNPVSTLQS